MLCREAWREAVGEEKGDEKDRGETRVDACEQVWGEKGVEERLSSAAPLSSASSSLLRIAPASSRSRACLRSSRLLRALLLAAA